MDSSGTITGTVDEWLTSKESDLSCKNLKKMLHGLLFKFKEALSKQYASTELRQDALDDYINAIRKIGFKYNRHCEYINIDQLMIDLL